MVATIRLKAITSVLNIGGSNSYCRPLYLEHILYMNNQIELLESSDTYTSLFLCNQINKFRNMEGNQATLLHFTLLLKIEKEFDECLTDKNFLVSYKDSSNKQNKMYNLDYEQSLIILMSESKYVRKSIIEIIKDQQARIAELEKPSNSLDGIVLLLRKSLIELENAKPKVDLADQFLLKGKNMNLRDTACKLHIKDTWLKQLLISKKYIYKIVVGLNKYNEEMTELRAYSEYENCFELRSYVAKNGHAGNQLLVTPEGLAKINKLVNKEYVRKF